MGEFDYGLLSDLKSRSLLNSTRVIWGGEVRLYVGLAWLEEPRP